MLNDVRMGPGARQWIGNNVDKLTQIFDEKRLTGTNCGSTVFARIVVASVG